MLEDKLTPVQRIRLEALTQANMALGQLDESDADKVLLTAARMAGFIETGELPKPVSVWVILWAGDSGDRPPAEIGEVYATKEHAEHRIEDLSLAAGKRGIYGEAVERPVL